MRVYLAGPGRGVSAPRGSVEAIRATLEAEGHDIVNPASGPPGKGVIQQIETRGFIEAVDRMLEADLLVAEVSTPSHGVGWAVAWFLAKGRLAVLCCKRDARSQLSGMLSGNPSPWQKIVLYDDLDELSRNLGELLHK